MSWRVTETDKKLYAVSIHAPVWVRRLSHTHPGQLHRFQFTHPCGCDHIGSSNVRISSGFNSRTRVGATGVFQIWLTALTGFNSRTRVGATGGTQESRGARRSFNSRTRVGATHGLQTSPRQSPVSIHAPVWVRPGGCSISEATTSFNSRTRVGATRQRLPRLTALGVSIHAPVWVRRPDEYGLSIKHATKVLRQPDARTRCGQA